jgi:hypothetical protein
MQNKAPANKILKEVKGNQLRLLREWVTNPWFSFFLVDMCDDQKMEIMKLIMDYRMNDTSQIFTREQLIGEVRGVEWVRELVSGTYARLQEEAKSEPPV